VDMCGGSPTETVTSCIRIHAVLSYDSVVLTAPGHGIKCRSLHATLMVIDSRGLQTLFHPNPIAQYSCGIMGFPYIGDVVSCAYSIKYSCCPSLPALPSRVPVFIVR
jgi:hypothetical protein